MGHLQVAGQVVPGPQRRVRDRHQNVGVPRAQRGDALFQIRLLDGVGVHARRVDLLARDLREPGHLDLVVQLHIRDTVRQIVVLKELDKLIQRMGQGHESLSGRDGQQFVT